MINLSGSRLERLFDRLHGLIDRLERVFPALSTGDTNWNALAWRWRGGNGGGWLEPILQRHAIELDDLLNIERQRDLLEANTRQFVLGLPCNNALLWGARGTGKTTLVKALLNRYAREGLRLIEIDAHDLIDLPQVVAPLAGRPERFLLFVDDLSFDADDSSYRTLKAALDGSIAVAPENVLIYATSNRRHLLPEQMEDNRQSQVIDGELHPGEAIEEKISLSERFGVWLSFHPFNQDQYLAVVRHWLEKLGGGSELSEACRLAALQWGRARGNRSGRVANQFAKDWVGRQQLGAK
jgi:hypothetical protein